MNKEDKKKAILYIQGFEEGRRYERKEIQQDIQSVLNMLEGSVDKQKIINYIKEYLLDI